MINWKNFCLHAKKKKKNVFDMYYISVELYSKNNLSLKNIYIWLLNILF